MTEAITGISVKGFKSIAEPVDIEIRPLTILAGANSSGKFHEILHMIAPNHSRVFKSFLCAYLPDWVEREKELRGYERDGLSN